MSPRGRVAVPLGALALAALFAPLPVTAQSLLSAGGLGIPIEPLDARARAIGGVEVGLFGPAVRPTDPTAAVDLGLPSASLTMAGSWIDVRGDGGEPNAAGTRFPALGLSYPVRSWGTATLTYGSVLEQRWEVSHVQTLPIGETTARVTDRFQSDGGIAALRLGFARRMSSGLALGASVGTYTGDLTRSLRRSFDTGEAGLVIDDTEVGGFWQYSGLNATVGAMVDVGDVLRVGANVSFSGDLKADPSEDTAGAGARYALPPQLRVGASGVLSPGLVASAGVTYADWTDVGAALQDESGQAAVTVGGGLEWTRANLFGRRSPFQVGYRRSTLPFTFGGERAVENVFSGGVGLDFIQDQGMTLAGVALALERGSRDAGPFSETFNRVALTVRVAGF